MTPKPLIAYCRVSKRGDREDGKYRSPEQQSERATKFAIDNGFTIGRVILDENQSGGKHPLERPGMAEALRDIAEGRAGGIVAFDMSRLSREPSHLEWLASEVAKHEAVLIWPGMPVDPHSASGELQIGVLAQFDRYTRKQAGERFRISQENAIRLGIPHGPIPFGFRQLEDRTIEPVPELVPLVLGIFEGRIRGEGWGAMAVRLAGVTDRAWSRRGLSHIVANALYRTGRLSSGNFLADVPSGEPIVDAATWYAAQSPKLVRDGRHAKGKWLCSGLLRCASCNRCLVPWTPSKGRSGTARRYRCVGLNCPSRVTVHGPAVEAMVMEAAFNQQRRLVSQPPEAVSLEPLIAVLEAAERRFAQVQAPAAMDALGDAWTATAKERRNERDAAASALGQARSEAGMEEDAGLVLELGHIWDDLDAAQQREALRWHFSVVRVSKVPAGHEPALTFEAAAVSRPFRLEFRPADIARQ